MRNPGQEPSPDIFTVGQIYTLIDDPKNADNANRRLALTASFNDLPRNYDGIAVYETRPSDTNEAADPIICFNGQLTEAETAGLRGSDQHVALEWEHAKQAPSLREAQKEEKLAVRSLPKFLGAVGISGAAGGGMVLFIETLGDTGAEIDTVLGLLVAGATYLATRSPVKKRKLRDAQHSVAALKERCLDGDQGAITFLRDKKQTYQVKRVEPPENAASDIETPSDTISTPNDTLNALWNLPGKVTRSYAIDRHNYALEGPTLDIQLGKLIKEVLTRDEKPSELWYKYLEEKARVLSDHELQINHLETEINRLEGIKTFTAGYTDESALTEHHRDLLAHREKVLQIVYDIVTVGEARAEERKRKRLVAAAEELLDRLATEEVTEAHSLEMDLQTFRSIAAMGLSHLDLGEQSTLDTANAVAEYLQETRSRLVRPDEIRAFYMGLYTQFSKRLPGLPEWEQAEKLFAEAKQLASEEVGENGQ